MSCEVMSVQRYLTKSCTRERGKGERRGRKVRERKREGERTGRIGENSMRQTRGVAKREGGEGVGKGGEKGGGGRRERKEGREGGKGGGRGGGREK